MEKHHSDVPQYGLQLKDEAAITSQLLEQVQEDLDSLKVTAAKQEHHLREGLHPRPQLTTKEKSPSSESSDSDYVPPSQTNDSSLHSSDDSSSNSSESSTADSTAETHPKGPKQTSNSLSLAQMEAVHKAATGLQGEPTLESLLNFPHAWKQPLSSVLAVQDRPPSQTPVAQLASALVMSDFPNPPPVDDNDLSDMPELEKTPPRKFPFPPKKHRKEDN